MSRYTNYIGNNYFKIIKGKEEELKSFIEKYDWGETLLHTIPPKTIGDNWEVMFGYKEGSTDINHFCPTNMDYWFEELSLLIEEKIDFICTDEEFPIINEKGFAYRLIVEKGKSKLNDLILNEEISNN